ncbi:MAG: TetR/AcrR family transcriptional regulator [Myxococcota bacterium]|jgi:TetR/AcrR family transcriptional repressor of bet genes|nr:TetR/AcrR family transcriptional regulator [Myxococcota bacterium]
MARPSNTAERKVQITQALMQVMAKRGYDRASIQDVARAAGLTPGLVHYHFKNKQEILLSLLQELVSQHQAQLAALLTQAQGDPISELEAFLDLHLGLGAHANSEALACWLLISAEALREPDIRLVFAESMAALRAQLSTIIARGIDASCFACSPQDTHAISTAIIALIQGYLSLAGSARSLIPKGSAAHSARLMSAALLAPTRPLDVFKAT